MLVAEHFVLHAKRVGLRLIFRAETHRVGINAAHGPCDRPGLSPAIVVPVGNIRIGIILVC